MIYIDKIPLIGRLQKVFEEARRESGNDHELHSEFNNEFAELHMLVDSAKQKFEAQRL